MVFTAAGLRTARGTVYLSLTASLRFLVMSLWQTIDEDRSNRDAYLICRTLSFFPSFLIVAYPVRGRTYQGASLSPGARGLPKENALPL